MFADKFKPDYKIGPYVICKVTGKIRHLEDTGSGYVCHECQGHDRQASYYENHEVVEEKDNVQLF